MDNIEQDNNIFALEKPLVLTTIFDYRKWNRPLRYIKNDHFESAVRDENSQFFFHICQSDGKERISFTYPPDLSSFLKIMEKKWISSQEIKSPIMIMIMNCLIIGAPLITKKERN